MDIFSLRESLVCQYSDFARSFTQIRASDIREQVAAAYASGRFWPDPLIQINPLFKKGRSIAEARGGRYAAPADGGDLPQKGEILAEPLPDAKELTSLDRTDVAAAAARAPRQRPEVRELLADQLRQRRW